MPGKIDEFWYLHVPDSNEYLIKLVSYVGDVFFILLHHVVIIRLA